MRIAYQELAAAVAAALDRRGLSAKVQLQPIDLPRPWGVTSSACFMLGAQHAAAEIEAATAGLDKKAAKEAAGRLAREAGIALASEVGAELEQARQTGELTQFVERVEAEGAYLNFYYDARTLADLVIRVAGLDDPTPENPLDDFGSGTVPQGERKQIMVEYAQPNTHKDFHVGHLRNASIGQAIANLLEFSGHTVYKATYIGDIGAHVAKAMLGYKGLKDQNFLALFGWVIPQFKPEALLRMLPHFEAFLFDREAPWSTDPLANWSLCYQYYNVLETALAVLIDHNKSVLEKMGDSTSPDAIALTKARLDYLLQSTHWVKARAEMWLQAWELAATEGADEESKLVRSNWEMSRLECLNSFRRIFSELQVEFHPECWFYESTVDDSHLGQKTAEELKQRGIATIDESEEYKGALYVDFAAQAEAMRSDGSAAFQAADDAGRMPALPVFSDPEKKRIKQLGKMTILRSNGTSLYQTKELGLAKYKFDWVKETTGRDLDESLYVVGAEQKLYFEQVFAILRLWGFPNADKCKHIAYELVVLPEGKMSSREGTVVSYRELRDAAVKQAEDVIREKGLITDEAQIKQTAHDVAIAAIKYTMLQVSGNQQIVFDFAQALSFDGRAAPYLQYAYARAGKLVAPVGVALMPPATGQRGTAAALEPSNASASMSTPLSESVITKATAEGFSGTAVPGCHSSEESQDGQAGTPVPLESPDGGLPVPLHDSEIALARLLSQFPETCRTAAEKYEPAVLCNYLYAIADAFSAFYRDCRVLGAPEPERSFRQGLTRAFRYVMKTGFNILALPLPEAM